MKILILPDAQSASRRVADAITAQVAKKPDSVLGLATGGTMEPVYTDLVRRAQSGGCDISRVTTFNLDEYVGLAPGHPQSYRHFMTERLFAPLGIRDEQTHLPTADAGNCDQVAKDYERAINEAGGIDLQLLGIGHNGHIGFNEPTSSLASRTRVKTLTERTREANSRYFREDEEIPRFAITMGIGTILDTAEVCLLAVGDAKAAAVAAMVEGPVSARCPASALQFHRKATIVLDEAAASRLELRDYYDTVHPGGAETGL